MQRSVTNVLTSKNDVAKDGNVQVRAITYQKYDTGGPFEIAVEDCKQWLESYVATLEADAATPCPLMHPSVMVILLGHSMGGLLAVDVARRIRDEGVEVPQDGLSGSDAGQDLNFRLEYPKIIATICYDSPFFGVNSSAFCNTVWTRVQRWYEQAKKMNESKIAEFLQKNISLNSRDIAIAAGTIGASVALAGAAFAIVKRHELVDSMNWLSDRNEFVHTLWNKEQMKSRIVELNRNSSSYPFKTFYTVATKGEESKTFIIFEDSDICRQMVNDYFVRLENNLVEDEIQAHMSMFDSSTNSSFEGMLTESARSIIQYWFDSTHASIK